MILKSGSVLATDIDDVIFPFVSAFIAYQNCVFGTKIQLAQVTDYFNFEEVLGVTRKEKIKRMHEFLRLVGLEFPPIIGAVEALDKLRVLFPNQAMITGRQYAVQDLSIRYLDKFLPDRKFQTVFCNHCIGDDAISKSEACLRLGVSHIIDDSLEYAIDCAKAGVQVLLFGDYPWNRQKIPKEYEGIITRTPSWQDVLAYFELS
ncbi:TPA: hypothetical protein DD449_00210 [Candidatus Berkelbacteria bacterium]|uniref:Uncharacterized protein n=1 Tax=Berkelbacteria bacterium GW2011_GWE1_39_12 TaxID=1618337 RepID=A0A0G4B1Y9_9BACT|nr:MAG: hypothetical protein UT28_C0001G0030 [Berkelbacteria bacterium GW2011_GWE1_39_12]HBO60097.1 hypothetical protein [Candidatus Berkelbacteria bacterium]